MCGVLSENLRAQGTTPPIIFSRILPVNARSTLRSVDIHACSLIVTNVALKAD